MGNCIVTVPSSTSTDYSYIAFSFNGKHSYEDMGIYRVSDGAGYTFNLNPSLTDKTVDVPGGDGQYFFGTQHKNKVFNIKFAFDNLSEEQFQKLKKWLNGKEMGDLWFAEEPYKVYTAKITGSATMTAVPFEGETKSGVYQGNIYKGTGSVTFTCYYPYAHTPDYVYYPASKAYRSGKYWSSYLTGFPYLYQKLLPGFEEGIAPYGELPFTFIANLGNLSGEDEATTAITYEMRNSGSTYTISSENVTEDGSTIIIGD